LSDLFRREKRADAARQMVVQAIESMEHRHNPPTVNGISPHA
jgi:hypothetical protein